MSQDVSYSRDHRSRTSLFRKPQEGTALQFSHWAPFASFSTDRTTKGGFMFHVLSSHNWVLEPGTRKTRGHGGRGGPVHGPLRRGRPAGGLFAAAVQPQAFTRSIVAQVSAGVTRIRDPLRAVRAGVLVLRVFRAGQEDMPPIRRGASLPVACATCARGLSLSVPFRNRTKTPTI